MAENVLKVERLYYLERDIFEYRIIVSSSLTVCNFDDEYMPSKYKAAYVCNNLREFVNDGKLSDNIETRVVEIKETGETTCPRCGQPVPGKAAHHD